MRRIMAWLLLMLAAVGGLAGAEEAFSSHILMDKMNRGACSALTGDVEVLAVFVDLPEAPWTEEARALKLAELEDATVSLEKDAARYDTELNMTVSTYRAFAQSAGTLDAADIAQWAADVLATVMTLPAFEEGRAEYAARPVVFLQNVKGRAFALPEYGANTAEFIAVFSDSAAATMRHELLHLFGAVDFHYIDVTEALARSLFPDSIMLDTEDECRVDEVTAYAVGWMDEPSETARIFLAATAHLTEEDVKTGRSESVKTGFGTSEAESYVYTGELASGVAHGVGQIRWDTGSVYTGSMNSGAIDGLGVYQWDGGQVFAGQWQEGVRTGVGACQYPDGSIYAGGFRDGKMDGSGAFAWAEGMIYAGEWSMGNRDGKGMLAWPDGGMLLGSFIGGALHGKGTQVWPDGSVYTGDWVNGARTGVGVMQWADGNTYTGSFVDGGYQGWGVLTRPDGTSLSGWWDSGVYCGQQPPAEQ